MADLQPELPVAATPADAPTDTDSIFRLLRRGLGHELVNKDNVDDLIRLAIEHGHPLIEQELREWHTGCGSSAGLPGTTAPNSGFSRPNNARR